MENSSWKYTLWRAARTFVQTALGYIVTALGGGLAGIVDADGHIIRTAVVGLIISAIAAGLAALMNLPEAQKDEPEEEAEESEEAEGEGEDYEQQ